MPYDLARFDRGSPVVAIINASPDINVARLRRAVRAIQKQIDRDFFPLWGWRADLVFEEDIPPGAMLLTIVSDNPDDDDAEGYHFVDGVPHGEMYTRDNNGRRYSEADNFWTLSHEILEMIADPGVNLYASGYRLVGKQRRHHKGMIAFEVCDAVQDRHYPIDTIRVSDFVVPEWFEPEHPRGSMDFSFLGAVREPFAITAGGYIDAVVDGKLAMKSGPRAAKHGRRHRFEARARRMAGI